jgi:hypothetical protein
MEVGEKRNREEEIPKSNLRHGIKPNVALRCKNQV